ncbi:helix-turn-helix domain-containing protein [Magnetospirillum sp. UT-4]|uniref:helix-turn-helix domain-containing protein n=1 Tax=Magnetospirillum sp. UT-4 TaxID=2681467 RepID=UPI001381D13D|nr:helix-turn-helix transcriptional regulator [Magnetospirillum sp. UT-4]CAA7621116.1 Putative DNA binding helix-turn helix protein (modular protein) [Magnetospirillum sp. UT-4]
MSPIVTSGNTKKWRAPQDGVSQFVSMPQDMDKPDAMRVIGQRLRATREALGLTQEQLALSIGVTRTAYTNWERGDRMPDPLAVVRLADRYGVTLDWIYRGQLGGMPHSLATKIEPLLSRSSQAGG